MLTGPYEQHQNAVVTFTDAECEHANPGHVASCTVTVYASQGGAVVKQYTARLPVADHMEPAAIAAMFQAQFHALPDYSAMTAS